MSGQPSIAALTAPRHRRRRQHFEMAFEMVFGDRRNAQRAQSRNRPCALLTSATLCYRWFCVKSSASVEVVAVLPRAVRVYTLPPTSDTVVLVIRLVLDPV